jgi:hypothetical protein
MRSRSLVALLALATVSPVFIPAASTAAELKAAAAQTYGLRIQHAKGTTMRAAARQNAIQLDLMLTNPTGKELYDVRLYLIRPDTRLPLEEPARLRVLPAGKATPLSWTFELPEGLPDAMFRRVSFRVEAVDPATKQIVSFTQASTEVR